MSQDLSQGQTFSTTFTTPGTFPYVCGIHPFMNGTVVVRG
jgi:plastocyanin